MNTNTNILNNINQFKISLGKTNKHFKIKNSSKIAKFIKGIERGEIPTNIYQIGDERVVYTLEIEGLETGIIVKDIKIKDGQFEHKSNTLISVIFSYNEEDFSWVLVSEDDPFVFKNLNLESFIAEFMGSQRKAYRLPQKKFNNEDSSRQILKELEKLKIKYLSQIT